MARSGWTERQTTVLDVLDPGDGFECSGDIRLPGVETVNLSSGQMVKALGLFGKYEGRLTLGECAALCLAMERRCPLVLAEDGYLIGDYEGVTVYGLGYLRGLARCGSSAGGVPSAVVLARVAAAAGQPPSAQLPVTVGRGCTQNKGVFI